MPAVDGASGSYGVLVGLVYVFNLIIGTGALSLPKAFQEAGLLLGTLILAVSCFISYMGATFVIESMSSANAVLHHQSTRRANAAAAEILDREEVSTSESEESETETLLATEVLDQRRRAGSFEIKEKVELSEMASIFLGPKGLLFFQLCLIVYLFGDLAIYSTVVPKSLMALICTYEGPNHTCLPNATLDGASPCRDDGPTFLTRITMYRFMTVAFALLVCPFVFFGVTKTKYLQMFTTASRWLAFILMIAFAIDAIAAGKGNKNRQKTADISGFGKLFGITVYSFMCHHSLPSLVTPMKQKTRVHILFLLIYILILGFYATLALTGSFAFAHLEDVYTLNFVPHCLKPGYHANLGLTIAEYFLTAFPVFTLSTNFPIVGITLSNNLRALYDNITKKESPENQGYTSIGRDESAPAQTSQEQLRGLKWFIQRLFIPTLVILPPVIIALITDDVQALASITGSYAGVGVQYILPALLAIYSRRKVKYWLERRVPSAVSSPFKSTLWPTFLLIWAFITVIIVSVNYGISGVK